MRALYDLYVDAAEEGYAEVALSDEFREVYGALVNSQMRVRQMVQGEIERSTASLGIPGRTELDSVHKRIAELRRRVADLEERLAAQATAAPSPMVKPAPVAAKAARKVAAKPAATVKRKSVATEKVVAAAAGPAPADTAPAPKSNTRRSRS
jgi:hypothetical protein